MTSVTTRQRLQKQLAALDAKIAGLESAPVSEAHYEYQETGETYRQKWATLDSRGKAAQLAKSGITLAAGIEIDGRRSKYNAGAWHIEIRVPDDWPQPDPVELPTDPGLDARIAAQQRRRGDKRVSAFPG
jgi:site-specific DNA recombinase